MSNTAVILGSNGRLGRELVRAFAGAGWTTYAVARQPRLAAEAPSPRVRPVAAAAQDTDALARAVGNADVVVFAANAPYTRWPQEALPLLQSAIDAAERLRACLLFPGNVYNYGEHMPPMLRPDTPQQADTRKGRVRIAMEQALADAATSRGVQSVVIRAGEFIGGGAGNWFDNTITRAIGKGRLTYPGRRDVPHAWAYLPDLARAFVVVAAARASLPPHARLHFSGYTLTGEALCAALSRVAGQPLKVGGMPWPLLRVVAPLVPILREVIEMRYLWDTPHGLDGTALQAVVGAIATTPLDEALRAALIELGALASHGAAANPGLAR